MNPYIPKEKRGKYNELTADWNPGDCLKLTQTAYSSDDIHLRPNTIYRLIEISEGKNYVIVQSIEIQSIETDKHVKKQKSTDLSLEADDFGVTAELHGENFYKREYSDEIIASSSFFVKVNCDNFAEIISTTPKQESTMVKSTIKALEPSLPNRNQVKIVSVPLNKIMNSYPFLFVDGKYNFSRDSRTKLYLFEPVKVIGVCKDKSKSIVKSINDDKEYEVDDIYLTNFIADAGQVFNIKDSRVTVKSKDPDNDNNVIVKYNKTGEYSSIATSRLIRIRGNEMSRFYSITINEPITEIDEIKRTCIDISEDIKTLYQRNLENLVTGITITDSHFQYTDDCFIEYVKEAEDTIYIKTFTCSSEEKGTGRNLFCEFLRYIITKPEWSNIKYIKLIAQPFYVSISQPSFEYKKLLQKMLNNLYRALGFKKITRDNEFMGCISDLIQPCLEKITFTKEEEKQERFLNDIQNSGPPTNIRVSFPSFYDIPAAAAATATATTEFGGSKRRTKKRNRKKSIKKNNFFEMKRIKSKKRRITRKRITRRKGNK